MRLADYVEARLQRGLPRRVLESRVDVEEVQAALFKISVRIEAFLVSFLVSCDLIIGLTKIVRNRRLDLNRHGRRPEGD